MSQQQYQKFSEGAVVVEAGRHPSGVPLVGSPFQQPLMASPYPANTVCTGCQQPITTYTREVTGAKTKWGMGAFFCGLGLLFFWIPLVVRSFKDIEHWCPRCNAFQGVFRPSAKGAKIACAILTVVQVIVIVLVIVFYAAIIAAMAQNQNNHNQWN